MHRISRSITLLDISEFDNLLIGGENTVSDKVVLKIYGLSNAFCENLNRKLFLKITNAIIEVSDKTRSQKKKMYSVRG